jgi:Tfp pilus assembly protein PilZ
MRAFDSFVWLEDSQKYENHRFSLFRGFLHHMFPKSKITDVNIERREHKRTNYTAMISHEILTDENIQTSKMFNFSKGGLYFESDQTIHPGDKILIKLLRLPDEPDNYEQFPFGIEIIWHRDLQNSDFRYGYGAKYTFDNVFVDKGTNTSEYESQILHDNQIEDEKDPRQEPRRCHNQPLHIRYNNQIYKGIIRNISLGGAFIETKCKFSLGTVIKLVVSEGAVRKKSKLKGRIVRFSQEGFAVNFAKRSAD